MPRTNELHLFAFARNLNHDSYHRRVHLFVKRSLIWLTFPCSDQSKIETVHIMNYLKLTADKISRDKRKVRVGHIAQVYNVSLRFVNIWFTINGHPMSEHHIQPYMEGQEQHVRVTCSCRTIKHARSGKCYIIHTLISWSSLINYLFILQNIRSLYVDVASLQSRRSNLTHISVSSTQPFLYVKGSRS